MPEEARSNEPDEVQPLSFGEMSPPIAVIEKATDFTAKESMHETNEESLIPLTKEEVRTRRIELLALKKKYL